MSAGMNIDNSAVAHVASCSCQIRCLKVPCAHAGKWEFVKTHCAPKIPATILLPDATGKELNCQGHQTHSDFQPGHATSDLIDCESLTKSTQDWMSPTWTPISCGAEFSSQIVGSVLDIAKFLRRPFIASLRCPRARFRVHFVSHDLTKSISN